MSVYIRFENEADLKWLAVVLNNTLSKAQSNITSWCDQIPTIERCVKSIEAPIPMDKVMDVASADLELPPPEKPKSKKKQTPNIKANLCPDHPNYGGMSRRPTTDCETCWGVFKKFNPNRYASSRRSFTAAQRKKNA